MFFDNPSQIRTLSEKTNFAIFVLKDFLNLEKIYQLFPKTTLILKPDNKTGKITIDDIRTINSHTISCETNEKFFIVENAEKMNESAENAFLKNLEEPKKNVHFVLLIKNLSALLPTIRSRAEIYVEKTKNILEMPINSDEKVKALAKKLITATPTELIKISSDVTSKKDNARLFALEVVGTSIEIVYKSYFATRNEKFLKKLPSLLTLYSNLEKNGHIRLHFVADML